MRNSTIRSKISIRNDLDYHNGLLIYNSLTRFKSKIGTSCGKQERLGYVRMYDGNNMVYRHRYIWTMHFGGIPIGKEVDHINHIRNDDRIENLRLVTKQYNTINRKSNKNNTSGYHCIYPMKSGRYRVRVRFKGVTYGSCVDSLSEAISLRNRIFIDCGFHENHGKAQNA